MLGTCAKKVPLQWTMVLWVTVLVFGLVVYPVPCSCSSDEDSSLSDTLRTLKAQVSALLDRRQEDYRLLEESLRRSLEKNSELTSLRKEVTDLRKEVETLRRGNPIVTSSAGNQQKNDHLTVQWLAKAVSELRGEVTEVAAAHNTSAELQRREELNSELGLLRGDVGSMRRDLEELQAGQQKGAAALLQVQQDVMAIKAQAQNAAAVCADTRTQLQTAQTEWSITLKALKKSARAGKMYKSLDQAKSDEERENIPQNLLQEDSGDRKYRHHRVLRMQVAQLDASNKKLSDSQSHLDHQVRRLEKQIKTLLNGHRNIGNHEAGAGEVAARQLQGRVSNLEMASRMSAKTVFNITRQLVGLDKLHQSMLQLLESVETLENKVDRSIPDLQREISKMEFNMAQMTSSISLIKEDQDNQRSSVKALSGGISSMQEKLETDHGRLSILQAQVLHLNTSLQHPHPQIASSPEAAGTEVTNENHINSSSSISQLVRELTLVQREYQQIISSLPRDCGSVQGPSGLYLISPGSSGHPLLSSCDQGTSPGGWTVVQRRVDGSQEFNRKWSEYATGFGSPSGEFWLGNEALHRLTADNCSSLRVDLRDIYGKSWVAEYNEFSISDAEDGYRLHVDGYRGNASDALEYQNRMQFSAIDLDRDISNTHCAANYEGGWWFSHCQHANLNGRYNLGLTWFDGSKNEWIAVAWSEMKVRRRSGCEPHG